jgi:diacylglycerol kinase family enzyme
MNFFNIGERKKLSDGKLSVYLLHRTGRFGLAKLVLRTVLGALKQAKDFEVLSTANVEIETRRKRKRLLVATDGEVLMMDAPLRYRILPNALRVIVPKTETGA